MLIKNKLLAYYKEDKKEIKKETLEDHVKSCIHYYENFKRTKFWKTIENLYLIDNFIEYAIKFHDVGKIFYQKNIVKKDDKIYLSFLGHEFFSTWMLYKLIKKYKENLIQKENTDEDKINQVNLLEKASLFAVLYHHHAMDIKSRLNSFRELDVKKLILSENEYEEVNKDFSLIFKIKLEDIDNNFKYYLIDKDKLKNKIENIYGIIQDINNEIWKKYAESSFNKKVMLIVLLTLIYSDYKVSNISRKSSSESPGYFMRVIDEIDNYVSD